MTHTHIDDFKLTHLWLDLWSYFWREFRENKNGACGYNDLIYPFSHKDSPSMNGKFALAIFVVDPKQEDFQLSWYKITHIAKSFMGFYGLYTLPHYRMGSATSTTRSDFSRWSPVTRAWPPHLGKEPAELVWSWTFVRRLHMVFWALIFSGFWEHHFSTSRTSQFWWLNLIVGWFTMVQFLPIFDDLPSGRLT